jgi:hypothetical protein
MNNSKNIIKLKSLTCILINKALVEIKKGRQNSSTAMEAHFRTAEYLLLEAKEYIDGAWEMLEHNKPNASLALSRWVVEAFMNLLWAVADKDQIKPRLMVLAGESLRCEAHLLEGLADLWPNQAIDFKNHAKKAIKEREALKVEKIKSLCERIKNIRFPNKPNWPSIYVLYRICSAAAHPNLKVWERFALVGHVTVSRKPIDKRRTACWMAAASTLYLVFSAYCLTKLRNVQNLDDWWSNQVAPLLKNSGG